MYSIKLSSGSTIQKFDDFVKQKDSMKIEDSITFRINGYCYCIHLIFEHLEKTYNKSIHRTKVTASDIKKCFKGSFEDELSGKPINEIPAHKLPNMSLPTYHFLLLLKNSLETELSEKDLQRDDIIELEIPIAINAQTSSDMDYEWGSNMYGDTSTFYITKYQIGFMWKTSSYT